MSNITSKLTVVAASLALMVLGTGCKHIFSLSESDSMSESDGAESDGEEADAVTTDGVKADGVKADAVTTDGYHEEGKVPATSTQGK